METAPNVNFSLDFYSVQDTKALNKVRAVEVFMNVRACVCWRGCVCVSVFIVGNLFSEQLQMFEFYSDKITISFT